jgi:hypothetical protein
VKLIIDRSKWARGVGDGVGVMRNSEGKCCVIGFLGEACGVAPECLIGKQYPISVEDSSSKGDPRWPTWLFSQSGLVKINISNQNDCDGIDDATREKQLTELFAEHGVEVEFVDGAVAS